jgi:hypothetical protein
MVASSGEYTYLRRGEGRGERGGEQSERKWGGAKVGSRGTD